MSGSILFSYAIGPRFFYYNSKQDTISYAVSNIKKYFKKYTVSFKILNALNIIKSCSHLKNSFYIFFYTNKDLIIQVRLHRTRLQKKVN